MAAAAESRGLAHHAPRSLRLRARSPPPDTLRAARCVASAAAAGDHGVREATPADLDGLADVEVACGNYEWGRDAIKVRERGKEKGGRAGRPGARKNKT